MGNTGPDSYTPPPPRYNDWHRDRDRDRERERRYRDDWRDMDIRGRDRDSYMMRYDNPAYGPPPPLAPPSLSMSYPPSFGGDSYRPDRDRDRDMPPSPGGPHLPYYDRDRMDDRDFYRHVPRNGPPMDSDRYRGRPARSWGPSSSPAPSVLGPIKARERDREREGSIKSPRSATSASGMPLWAPVPQSATAAGAGQRLGSGGRREDDKAEFRSDDTDRISGYDGDSTMTTPKRGNTPDRKESDRPESDRMSIATGERTSPPPSSNASEIAEVSKAESETSTTRSVVEDVPRDSGLDVTVKKEEEDEEMVEPSPVITTTAPATPPLPAETATKPESRTEPTTAATSANESAPPPHSPLSEPQTQQTEVTAAAGGGGGGGEGEVDKNVNPEPMEEDPSGVESNVETNKAAVEDVNSHASPPSATVPAISAEANAVPESLPAVTTKDVEKTQSQAQKQEQEQEQERPAEQAVAAAEAPKLNGEKQLSQQEIVERIDQIENDITMYEELLEQLNKREEEGKKESNDEHETVSTTGGELGSLSAAEEQKEREEEEAAKQQALQVISEETSRSQHITDIENLSSLKTSPVMRKRPQLLINQVRSNDETDDLLSEKLIADNRKVAKENSKMIGGWQGKPDTADDWSDEEEWTKPLYRTIDEFPCYKENVKNFDKVKVSIANSMAQHKKALKKKEMRLKKEYRELYEEWKQRCLTLDRIRDHERRAFEKYTYRSQSRRRTEEETEEFVDGVIFNSDHDALRFGTDGIGNSYGGPTQGAWTSDAARSEAELLEIIQSLESADMRNPELRAAKTTATIPAMILDEKERMRTFDDRSGLVMDPLTYYHTGPETEDHWTQQEMTAFMESYMQYPKQFEKIAAAVQTKTAPQCVLFYYRKKTKIDFKALVSKGRRGKAGKRRDRLAAAIRRATGGGSSTTRKGKSKGSALMTDIGEAQVSRKAKLKETERKSRELRELEEANAYWDGVHERRRSKRPGPTPSASAPTAAGPQTSAVVGATGLASAGTEELDKTRGDKRKLSRRKGRSPRGSASAAQVVPGEPPANSNNTNNNNSNNNNEELMDEMDSAERNLGGAARWLDKDKEAAIEAFKVHGRNFTRVAALVGTKTEDQCRNFYHNYKRKFGPYAFDEEPELTTGAVASSTAAASAEAPIKASPATAAPGPTGPTTTAMVSETTGARPDLKAEEEDAAAALMGMCRMGAATPPPATPSGAITTAASPAADAAAAAMKPTQGHTRTLSTTQMDDQRQGRGSTLPAAAATITTTATSTSGGGGGQQRRRRARTSSGKAVDSDMMDEWMETEFTANRPARRPGRPPGSTMSSDPVKRPAYSSYWSVSERSEFMRLLEKYGCDWDKVASALTTKTATQARNFYVNNEEKMQLDEIVKRRERAPEQQHPPAITATAATAHHHQPPPPPPPPPSSQPQAQQQQQTPAHPPLPPPSQEPVAAYEDSSKTHFRVMQNLPFHQPVAPEQHPPPPPPPTYASPSMSGGGPRVGYFTPSPPAPPSAAARQHQQPGVIHAYPPSHPPPPPGYSTMPPQHPQPQSSPSIAGYPQQQQQPPPPSHHPQPHHHHHHHPQQQQQQQQHAHPYSHMHSDRSAHPLQPPSPHPPPPANVSSEPASSSVTKVADLLNSDEPSDSTNQNNWESWFS
ncbi:hypothetical protein BDB00DRAFT_354589 [Zychaea mexicana]|uniref:uncharacterized protein n=1 Tax=Zychaea mexicana TaxID=64656 RepID=UPI0022FEEF43|nr:uncharacterized protein BDB00DRAFT_354589 [Zychaea mexicana]KAI9493782.1 hypothetical protein BDB00DRAFT_354589 [Zychaea mexicana]